MGGRLIFIATPCMIHRNFSYDSKKWRLVGYPVSMLDGQKYFRMNKALITFTSLFLVPQLRYFESTIKIALFTHFVVEPF